MKKIVVFFLIGSSLAAAQEHPVSAEPPAPTPPVLKTEVKLALREQQVKVANMYIQIDNMQKQMQKQIQDMQDNFKKEQDRLQMQWSNTEKMCGSGLKLNEDLACVANAARAAPPTSRSPVDPLANPRPLTQPATAAPTPKD